MGRWSRVAWSKAAWLLIAIGAIGSLGHGDQTSDLTETQYNTMTSMQRYDRASFASRTLQEFSRFQVVVSEATAGIGKSEDVSRWLNVMRNRIVLLTDADAKTRQDDWGSLLTLLGFSTTCRRKPPGFRIRT